MHALPDGWPRAASALFYEDPKAAIDWLCEAFGFEVRLIVEGGGGAIVHSEIVYGDALLMIGAAGAQPWARSPKQAGGNTQAVMVIVDDVEAHLAHAVKHGATVYRELSTTDYGDEYWTDRTYGASDPEGHHFWFVQRMRTGHPRWSEVRNKIDRSGHA